MPEAFNASNAIQSSSRRTCTRQADGGGRYPVQKSSFVRTGTLTTEDVQAFVDSVESTRPATDAQLQRIREASRHDAQLQKVMDATLKGWPAGVEDVPYQIREFFASRGHL